MKVDKIRKELEPYSKLKVILNLRGPIWEHTNYIVEDFLAKDEIPFECYEILYDWDEYGAGDGHDVVCFYSEKPGYLETHPSAAYAYSAELKEKYK